MKARVSQRARAVVSPTGTSQSFLAGAFYERKEGCEIEAGNESRRWDIPLARMLIKAGIRSGPSEDTVAGTGSFTSKLDSHTGSKQSWEKCVGA